MEQTYRCKLYEVDSDLPCDHKPRSLPPFSVRARNGDRAIKKARNYQRDRGRVVRSTNLTHNRNEIVVYVLKRRPDHFLEPHTVKESELKK